MVKKTTNDLVTLELRKKLFEERRRLREEMKDRTATAYVYYLLEPHSLVVRYVGVAQSVHGRLGSHVSQAVAAKTPVAKWVRSLLESGDLPRCEIAARVSAYGGIMSQLVWVDFAVRALERAIVQHAKNGHMPCNLGNLTGGEFRADLLNVEYLRGSDFKATA